MKNTKTRTIAYLAMYVALYIVLKWLGNLIPFLNMPNGGSIELELVAVFLASYHLGWKLGLATALLSWLITIILGFGMWLYYPVQIILDYVFPLAICGLSSLLWPHIEMKKPGIIVMSVLLALAAFFGVSISFEKSVLGYVLGIVLGLGLAGMTYWFLDTRKRFGIVIAMLLKYVSQVLSGVFFWYPEGAAAGSSYAWAYSISYNLWYNLVTMVVCMILVPLLIDRLQKAKIQFKA